MALKIALIVHAWENGNFQGRQRVIVLEEDKSLGEMIKVGLVGEFSFMTKFDP